MKALITGASSGMGRDMARYLATGGHDLILVARRKERLEELKKELTNVKVTIVPMDISKKENCFKLYDKFKSENIDMLINNAGFGLFGTFDETDLDRELEMIDVNVISYHILNKLFLKDFVKRNYGYILNTCSMAGFMPGPRLNTYYATKNYVAKMTMAINEELRHKHSNVSISALCPGPVNTEFNDVAHGAFTIKGVSSEYVAKLAIDKTLKRKMLIIPTFRIKLLLFLIRFAPHRLTMMINYHVQFRKEQKGKK